MKAVLVNKTTCIVDCRNVKVTRESVRRRAEKKLGAKEGSRVIHYYQASSVNPSIVVASLKVLKPNQARGYARDYLRELEFQKQKGG